MINLYELKVMDRLCNMLFKMPNFTKINNTSDTEFLKYSIAVDCGFTVEDSEIGYMDKIFDLKYPVFHRQVCFCPRFFDYFAYNIW